MPRRRYVERLTSNHEGEHLVDPNGKEWIVKSVHKNRAKMGVGRRTVWMAYLQDPDRRSHYEQMRVSRITGGAWTWGDGEPPASAPRSTATRTAPRDERGRRLCKACREPIQFIKAQGTGRAIPVDHGGIAARDVVERADDLSDVSVVTRAGEVLRGEQVRWAAEDDLTVFRSHFASCTKPEAFRNS
jgi:hypothetical protein